MYVYIYNVYRYNVLFGDLKIALLVPYICRLFLSQCIDIYLNILYTCEYYHIQTRVIQRHIEYENDDWVGFFNFNIALYALYLMLMTAFSSQNSGLSPNPGGNLGLGTDENSGLGTVPPDEDEWVAVRALWECEMNGVDGQDCKIQGGGVERECYHDRVIEAYKAYCIKTDAAYAASHVIAPIVYEYVLFATPTDTSAADASADVDDTAMNDSDNSDNNYNNNSKCSSSAIPPTTPTATDAVSHPTTPPAQHAPQATSVPVPLITVPAFFYQLYQKLLTWQLQYISGQCKPSIQLAMIHNSTVQSLPLSLVEFPLDSYSFHLPLHRFFAVFIEG